jgi:hypothetical protein
MSSVKTMIDQNGYDWIPPNCANAFSAAAKIPNQRANPDPLNTPMAATMRRTPTMSVIQPQVRRSLNT